MILCRDSGVAQNRHEPAPIVPRELIGRVVRVQYRSEVRKWRQPLRIDGMLHLCELLQRSHGPSGPVAHWTAIIARIEEDRGGEPAAQIAQEHHIAENGAGSLRTHAAESSVHVREPMVIRLARRAAH